MCVSCVCCCVPCIAIRRVVNSALRMFCRLGSLSAIRRLLAGQYTPEPVVLPMSFSYWGGDKCSVSVYALLGFEFKGVDAVELYW